MKKRKGFTLVELLAVIVILAVILVIAVPQIMSVIESARKGSIESTAKLIAEGAEREYTNRKILGKDTNIECSEVANLNDKDYGSCSITFDNSGKATVKVTGKGKFEGYTCVGSSTNMECTKKDMTPTNASYFSYSEVEGNKVADVTVKDKSKCVSYLMSKFNKTEEYANKICSGNAYNESMSGLATNNSIPSEDYETAGIEVSLITINSVTIKDKDKCNAYLQNMDEYEEYHGICSAGHMSEDAKLAELIFDGTIPPSSYEIAGMEVTHDGISITGYNVEGGLDVVIPSEIDGKKVVAIADYAFTSDGIVPTTISNTKKVTVSYLNNSENKAIVTPLTSAGPTVSGLGITSVVIPNTITSIGNNAFKNNQLTEMTIPGSVTSVGSSAFAGNKLTSLTISDGVTSVGSSAFAGNKLTKLTIPGSVTSIGDSAFDGNKLTSIMLSVGVTNIGDYAFRSNQITEVTIPSSVDYIGEGAFALDCVSNWSASSGCVIAGEYYNELTKIVNKTNRAFDWNSIINKNSSSSEYTFITGNVTSFYKENHIIKIVSE